VRTVNPQGQTPTYGGLGHYGYSSLGEFLDHTAQVWNPDKVSFWTQAGTPLVLGERQGYFLYDTAGRRYFDLHLNGGTYNLGHRNPEIVRTLQRAADVLDIGNHHFPAPARTALAAALLDTCQPGMSKVAFAASGGEANDIAIKSARYATGRRKIVSITKAFHGCTGLALGATDPRFSERFHSAPAGDFIDVPHNDLDAMEHALSAGDVAAVIMETVPATSGFSMPTADYLPEVKRMCTEHGTLFVADEVQTGLMRTGRMWAIEGYGVQPDILVSAKGLGGGMYPLGCAVLSEAAGGWLDEDGWGHPSTGGGAELGCAVALTTLEITRRPQVQAAVTDSIARFTAGLAQIQAAFPDWLVEVRQNGLVIGLKFDHPQGGRLVMRTLYENGVWAIFATLDPSVLQFKPGLLLSTEQGDEILDRLATSVETAAREARR
jgi:acetylornithine/succinyldiaminopimelate/putrescine aminotransferase